MRVRNSVPAFIVLLICPAVLNGQQSTPSVPSVQRDPQAIAIINRALSSMGGVAAISAVQDYAATGQITYYWANKEVQGQATVKGRGTGQFRLDAAMPDGIRSWAVSNLAGAIKNFDGTSKEIPSHNALNFGSLTFPAVHLAAALQNLNATISYLGLVTRNGAQVYEVRVQAFSSQDDANGLLQKLSTRDFYIDSTSLQIVSVVDMVHSDTNALDGFPHELLFSNYHSVEGIATPFSIVETVNGQEAWVLSLQQISYNLGLQDSDFQM